MVNFCLSLNQKLNTMAEFKKAYEKMLIHEGGYVNDPDDPGGETYKGVSRKIHSKWDGWMIVDTLKIQSGFPANLEKDAGLQQMIEDFYQTMFWDSIRGDKIESQLIAESIFDFGVNAGIRTSVILAQMAVDAAADGIIGPKTLAALNSSDEEKFLAEFTIAKIARYINIVKKRPASKKYFYGWVRRALNDF